VAVIAHGYNHQTWFSVVNTPQQRADPQLEAIIRGLVASASAFTVRMQDYVCAK